MADAHRLPRCSGSYNPGDDVTAGHTTRQFIQYFECEEITNGCDMAINVRGYVFAAAQLENG